jgi:glutamate--cysteine ligase
LVPDECHFLNAIEEVIETGKSPACELIDKYNNEWQKDLKNVYRDCAY